MSPSSLLEIPTGGTGKVQIIYDFVTEAEERFLLEKIAAAGGDPPAGEAGAGETAEGSSAGEGAAVSSSTAGSPAAGGNKAGKAWGWKELNGRRSMYWGGTLLPSSGSLWPDVLGRIAETGVYDEWTKGAGKGKERGPNHCLVNEYLPSQGILPHTDGPAYLPCTATLSLGSHTILCLRSKPSHLSSSSSSSATSPAPTAPAPNSTSENSDAPPPSTAPPTDEIEKIDLFLPPRSLLVLTDELYSDWLHGIQPLPSDSSEVLKGCANWEGWWEWQASQAAAGSVDDGAEVKGGEEQDRAGTVVDTKEEAEKRKKLVEAGHGWQRGKRVSLTCRRVAKVRKGLFKLG